MKKEAKLLAWSILLSTGLSCLLLAGRVDHDFFSYYYAGKRIFEGAAMYRDVYGNKGPWLYWFFAGLYAVFRDNYTAALIIGGGILDGAVVWLLWHILDTWLGGEGRDKRYKYRYLGLAGATLVYKGLTLDHFGGGIYSENVAMLWLLLSLVAWEKDKKAAAGAGFALAVLTRQTLLFFLPVYILRSKSDKGYGKWAGFIKGGVAAGLVTMLWLTVKPGLPYVWDSVVKVNFQYAASIRGNYLSNLATRLTMEPIVLASLAVMTVTIVIVICSRNYSFREKQLLAGVGVFSVITTWAGGYFYAHHFIQMSLYLGLCIGLLPRIRLARGAGRLAAATMVLGLILGYGYIWSANINGFVNPVNGLLYKPPEIADISQAKYLVVVPYWAKLYFDYDKPAPDRFYDQYFLSSTFNKAALEKNVQEHIKMDPEVARNTIFLLANGGNETDASLIQEYKHNFVEKFGLVKKNEYIQGKFLLEEYVPSGW